MGMHLTRVNYDIVAAQNPDLTDEIRDERHQNVIVIIVAV